MVTSNNRGPLRRVMSQTEVVPNSDTALTSKNAVLYSIHVANVTAGAVTLTVKDKQSTPRRLLASYSIPANSFIHIDFTEGVPMPGGVNWQASAATSLEGYLDILVKE